MPEVGLVWLAETPTAANWLGPHDWIGYFDRTSLSARFWSASASIIGIIDNAP